MSSNERTIPDRILIPLVREFMFKNAGASDGFTHAQKEEIRHLCGEPYSSIPFDDFNRLVENTRKQSKFGRLTGPVAPEMSFSEKSSEKYREYMASPEWKRYANSIREMWGWRCAICYLDGELQVHHRTYERLGEEWVTDCIPVCVNCHRKCDERRRREHAAMKAEKHFPRNLFR